MGRSCGLCGWALGKGDRSAPGTQPESRVGLGCLEECLEARGCPGWRAGGQPQVAQHLGNHGGIFDSRQDGQGAPALGTSGEVDGEDAFE